MKWSTSDYGDDNNDDDEKKKKKKTINVIKSYINRRAKNDYDYMENWIDHNHNLITIII